MTVNNLIVNWLIMTVIVTDCDRSWLIMIDHVTDRDRSWLIVTDYDRSLWLIVIDHNGVIDHERSRTVKTDTYELP